MKKSIARILGKKKNNVETRLQRKQYADQARPMFQGGKLHYEISEKAQAISYGGIGAIHTLVRKVGLDKVINDRIPLLKTHVPYFESDHVLNMAYNILCGGTCLQDLERLRQDDAYCQALGAERIPDPTTAGDFLRRFDEPDIMQLQEGIHEIRQKMWARQGEGFHREAILDVDGTIAPTDGECKEGMDIAYNGEWGYAPLVVTLANTKEVLYLVNRPGNRPSSERAGEWIERSIRQLEGKFEKIWLRGDTDFSMTRHLDEWEGRIGFVLGYDACPNLKEKAARLEERAWSVLHRPARYTVKTETRPHREKVKERIVREREYRNIGLESEHVAEMEYQPTHCRKPYRLVVLRKNLSIEKGVKRLFDEVRYFFYITNDWEKHAADIVCFANERCDQENIIAQLKNGVHALKMPSDTLLSNWAYMVIATLAWNLKAWYGMMIPDGATRKEVLRMEFKRFLIYFLQIPCQIVAGGRRILFRLLAYNSQLAAFFATFDCIQSLRFP